MNINDSSMIKALNLEDKGQNISLFLISSKTSSTNRLKKLDINTLNAENVESKLGKWNQAHRIIAVVEVGEVIFAYMHETQIARLDLKKEIFISDKSTNDQDRKVGEVKKLTDEQEEEFSAIVTQIVEKIILQRASKEEKKTEPKSETSYFKRSYAHSSSTLLDEPQKKYKQISNELFEAFIKSKVSHIVLDIMKVINEESQRLERLRKKEEKYDDIEREKIKKGIRRDEINHEEIKKKIG